jgi:5'-3' exonuclease
LIAGRKVAIDASMSIYQFLIAVRQDGSTLTNADGETTRCVNCYVTDYLMLEGSSFYFVNAF